MKKWIVVIALACIVLAILSAGKRFTFRAVVTENDGILTVRPIHAPAGLSDPLWVHVRGGTAELEPGDTVLVLYNGLVMESYPAQVSAIALWRIG